MSVELDFSKKLKDFTLRVSLSAGGERIGILGSSGGGKSMTLKCIAGIETPDEGIIAIDGVTVFDSARKIDIRPQRRNAGYLFQNYALFPTMTVAQNVGIAVRGKNRENRESIVDDAIRKMGLAGLERSLPARLSGGQQQRVALARILVSSPSILMLDEPFSALDAHLRSSVERELTESIARFAGTVLFVSHDRDELYRVCDRIAVIEGGELFGAKEKRDLFANPRTVTAARLSGCKNLARAVRVGCNKVFVPDWNLALETAESVDGEVAWVGVRDHHIRAPDRGETANCFTFSVTRRDAAPFSVLEYITATRGDGAESIDATATLALCREYPAGDDESDYDERVYCLPPDKILLLRE